MRQSKKFFEVLGRNKNGEIVVLDELFSYEDGLHGATGSSFMPVSVSQYENAISVDGISERVEEYWRERVHEGYETCSLDEFAERIINSGEADETAFDLSYCSDTWDNIRKAYPEYNEEEYPVFDCIGGGRMFPRNKPEELLRPDLWELILQAEEKELFQNDQTS